MALGADSSDDCDLLRAGRTRRLVGGWVAAPSTLETFLRAFTFGPVRQLDRVLAETLTRAWRAGAGAGRLLVDVDSFVAEVHGYQQQGAAFGYTKKRGYHPLLACRAETAELLQVRLRKGSANSQRGIVRFADELIARLERAGATGVKLLRANSGFWNTRLLVRCEQAGWSYTDRGAHDQARRRVRRADPRTGVDAGRRLPRKRGGADRRDDPRRPQADRPPRPQPRATPR